MDFLVYRVTDRDVSENLQDKKTDLWPDYDGFHLPVAFARQYVDESDEYSWMAEIDWDVDAINCGISTRRRRSVVPR